jgi:hypothetical protein
MLLSATDVPFGLKTPGKTTPQYQRLPVNLSLFRSPHFDLLPVTTLALLSATDVPFGLKAPGKTTPPIPAIAGQSQPLRSPHFEDLLPVT